MVDGGADAGRIHRARTARLTRLRETPVSAPAAEPVLPGSAAEAPGDRPLEWTVDPWRQHAGRAAAATLAAGGAILLAARGGLPAFTATVLAVAAGLAFAPGYLASHCRVDAGGVARRLGPLGWERRTWERLRAARLDARGLFVTAGPGRGAIATLRGLYLPLPANGDETLRRRLAEALQRHGL